MAPSRRVIPSLSLVLSLILFLGLAAAAEYSLVAVVDSQRIQIYYQNVGDAGYLFGNAWTVTNEVINAAASAGMPVGYYEQQFNSNSLDSNAYRNSISVEIQVHALGYLVECLQFNHWNLHPMLRSVAKALGVWIPGDINLDGTVDLEDQALLGQAWLSRPGDANWNPEADISGDGIVDLVDLGELGRNWHRSKLHSNPMDIEMRYYDRDWYWDIFD